MKKARFIYLGLILAVALTTTAFNLLSPEQEAHMGKEEFRKYKAEHKIVANGPHHAMTQRVATRLVRVVSVPNAEWEFVVFDDPTPNAFALPGGKVGIHTGLFAVVENEAQLAAVVGHELAHVKLRHSGERISNGMAGSAIGALAGKVLENIPAIVSETARTVPISATATFAR